MPVLDTVRFTPHTHTYTHTLWKIRLPQSWITWHLLFDQDTRVLHVSLCEQSQSGFADKLCFAISSVAPAMQPWAVRACSSCALQTLRRPDRWSVDKNIPVSALCVVKSPSSSHFIDPQTSTDAKLHVLLVGISAPNEILNPAPTPSPALCATFSSLPPLYFQ